MQDALFAPPPAPAVHHGEPDGRRPARKTDTKTHRWSWKPYRATSRTPCMACVRDLRDGNRTDTPRQAVWAWSTDAVGKLALLVCSIHRQEAVDGGLGARR